MPDPRPAPDATPAWAAALAGTVGVGVALAVGELLSGLTRAVPSPIDAVGQQVIPVTPEPVVRWAIDTFGAADIAVLNGGTTILALLLGVVAGLMARRGPTGPVLLFVGFGAAGLWASLVGAQARVVPTVAVLLVAVLAGLGTLGMARRAAGRTSSPPAAAQTSIAGVDRRRFLAGVAGVGVAAVVTAATGRFVLRGNLAVVDPDEVALPPPARALPPPPAAATLDVDGLPPLYTPNDRFFVIDTAVRTPQIAPEDWSLRVHGLVDREVVLTYDDLLAEPLEEFDVTIACVSNEVGGDLVDNARWLGTRLDALLERAGVQDAAEQLIGRSADGFTAGFPVDAARDGRDAIVAVAMNGAPLPTRHGFPARLIVPGLYGYVSATKWLTEIELTTWDVEGYWIPRGWAREGPIKTQSRIDVPRSGAQVPAGQVAVAGLAFAPTRGISEVEVRLDGGSWHLAELAEAVTDDAWVQWVVRLDVDAGDHVVQVRARDGQGELQAEDPRPPRPDGAEGRHRVTFRAV